MNKLQAGLPHSTLCECLTGFAAGQTPIWNSSPDSFMLWLCWIFTGETETNRMQKSRILEHREKSFVPFGVPCFSKLNLAPQRGFPIRHSSCDSFMCGLGGFITDQTTRMPKWQILYLTVASIGKTTFLPAEENIHICMDTPKTQVFACSSFQASISFPGVVALSTYEACD